MDIEKLVRMANQIATANDYGSDKDKVAAVVADHITRFWTPAMRIAIIEGHRENLVDLTPVAAKAVEKLAVPVGV